MENSILPYDIRQFCAGKVGLLDAYFLMPEGDVWGFYLNKYPYSMSDDILYIFSLSEDGYYDVEVSYGSFFPDEHMDSFIRERVGEEIYFYSNLGVGTPLDLPVYEALQTHCSMILACTLMFAVVFKGALFPCLRRKKKGL